MLKSVFDSTIKSLEVFYVINDMKPCARILCHEDNLQNILNFLKNNNLYYSLSDFKVLKEGIASQFYSDKSFKIDEDDERMGHFILYTSKNKKIAEDAKEAENKNNHKELGLLLGYPECCCNFFVKNFGENNTDLTLKTLENSEGFEFPFYTNICARHFDINLLSHFPCTFDCKQSLEIAKRNFDLLSQHTNELTGLFRKYLNSCVIYTETSGIFLLLGFKKEDNEVAFNNVAGTISNKIYHLLCSNKKIKITDKNNVEIGSIFIKGRGAGFMIFSESKL